MRRLTEDQQSILNSLIGDSTAPEEIGVTNGDSTTTTEELDADGKEEVCADKQFSRLQNLQEHFLTSLEEIFSRKVDARMRRSICRSLRDFLAGNLEEHEEEDENPSPICDTAANEVVADEDEITKYLASKFREKGCHGTVIEAPNGKDQVLVIRPYSQNFKGFQNMARRTRWIDFLLPNSIYRCGMLAYIAKNYPDDFNEVFRVYGHDIPPKVVGDTYYAEALREYLCLGSKQFDNLRAWLRDVVNVQLPISDSVKKEIEEDVHMGDNHAEPTFGTYNFVVDDQGEIERTQYWTAPIETDVCAEIELHY
mmetsp:Transcript_94090/g.271958  ORF Transcript_94090/g.271958 Transcript_94090/m.271958 type:complete len:310 (-) Transcript_94090:1871-2800(-)